MEPTQTLAVQSLRTQSILWARAVIPVTIYGALLMGLRYSARIGMTSLQSLVCLLFLGMGWTTALALGINRIGDIPARSIPSKTLSWGEPGLLLSRSNKTVVVLHDPRNPQSPRVLAIPGRALVHEQLPREFIPEGSFSAPLMSFRRNVPGLLQGIADDLASTAAQLNNRLNAGFLPFIIYAGGLLLALCSLRFIFTVRAWSLVNLCMGILIFRGVLALEALFNTPHLQSDLVSLLASGGIRFPASLLSPLLLYALGILLICYTLVSQAIRTRRTKEPIG
jgi:hypothetical protein